MIFLIAFSLGVYSTFSKIPKYRASATIMVTQKPGSQSLQNFGNSDNSGQINNKILLLKSEGCWNQWSKNIGIPIGVIICFFLILENFS